MRNIFIDLDGTLINISNRHFRVYGECVRQYEGVVLPKQEYWSMKRSGASWAEILERSKVKLIYEKEFLDRFIGLIEQPTMLRIDNLFNDSHKVLKVLFKTNKLYLLSLRRNRNNLLDQIDSLGIGRYFERIFSGHSDTKEGSQLKKAEIIREEGLSGHALIIGDAEADIVAAKNLKVPCVAVSTGIRSRDFLARMKPDSVVDSLTEALKSDLICDD